MCQIDVFSQKLLKIQKENVAVKPVHNLCICPYLSCICCCYYRLINLFCVMNFLQHLNSRVFDFASSLQSRKTRNWVPIKYVTDVNLKPPFLPALTRLSDGLKLLFLRNDKLPETRALFLNSCSQNSDTLTIFLILTVEPHWKRGDNLSLWCRRCEHQYFNVENLKSNRHPFSNNGPNCEGC